MHEGNKRSDKDMSTGVNSHLGRWSERLVSESGMYSPSSSTHQH